MKSSPIKIFETNTPLGLSISFEKYIISVHNKFVLIESKDLLPVVSAAMSDIINFSKDILKPKGVLVSKVFMGEDFIEVKNLAKSVFKKVNFFKPESSRKESKETYLHCEILKPL